MEEVLPSLQKQKKTQKALRTHSPGFPDLERLLLAGIMERRQAGHAVSTTELRMRAVQVARNEFQIPESSFKASYGWAIKFMNRHGLSIRRRTTIAQRLPDAYEDQILEFQLFCIRQRQRNDYPLSRIGNADQTPLTFDLPSQTTIHSKGDKSVSIKTTGHEKDRFTVMLTCTADGGKLAPLVVFKRTTLPRETFPKGVHVIVHPKGWMDERLVLDWEDIPEDVVRRSFLKTGIANKLDGTEDDLIWCDKVGEGEADDDEDGAEVR